MEDNVIVPEFLNYLKFEKRFSEHTAKCYGADLSQFGEFLIGVSMRSPSDAGVLSEAKELDYGKEEILHFSQNDKGGQAGSADSSPFPSI